MQKLAKFFSLMMVSGLLFTGCGQGGQIPAKNLIAPLEEQKAVEIIQGKDEDPLAYSLEQIDALSEIPMFSHLKGDDGSYANALKVAFGKNLSQVTAKTPEDEEVPLLSLVEDPSLGTLVVLSRSNCPYCDDLMAELSKNYRPDDFNLIIGEGHITEKEDVAEDREANEMVVLAEGWENLLPYMAYGTDPLMDELNCAYYPTLLYLFPNGTVMNVSEGVPYEMIKDIFMKSIEGSSQYL